MTKDLSIVVKGVGKKYVMYNSPRDRFKQMVLRPRDARYGKPFWAVRDISFEARRGETIGVIGRNGSGKSTLLQMIAGVLLPTEGDVSTQGRITALLELGSGFNPNFTGHENVYMNGLILGLTTGEITKQMPAILDFADIGDFIDQPVKHYSSGMMVRLAFAVQACVNPSILIVDEALSVGDVFFQQKCHAHMDSLLKNGTTIVLVSHNMGAIKRYSDRVIMLEGGRSVFCGDPTAAVQRYFWSERLPADDVAIAEEDLTPCAADRAPSCGGGAQPAAVLGGRTARYLGARVSDANGTAAHVFEMGDTVIVDSEFEALTDLHTPCGGITIHNPMNLAVYCKHSVHAGSAAPPRVPKGARIRFRHQIQLNLTPDTYTFDLGFSQIDPVDRARADHITHAELEHAMVRCCQAQKAGAIQVVPRSHGMEMPFLGLCDLPDACLVTVEVPGGGTTS
ncbi:MAG: ABC transporter ATP-binding protein [Lentisphaerae bacterium]|nr:ABC transporter ATP-binding protein [Lentisphaerota bacterium]